MPQKVPIAADPEHRRDLTGCLIRDVLTMYPAWNGTNEREYIRSQQRPAPPLEPILVRLPVNIEHYAGAYGIVSSCLAALPGWVTIKELIEYTGLKRTNINDALTYLRRRGLVERMCDTPGRGRIAGTEQMYRWVR